jgi:hypothetical protein
MAIKYSNESVAFVTFANYSGEGGDELLYGTTDGQIGLVQISR